MAAQLIEIEAVFLGEKFRFENADGDTIIGEARLSQDYSHYKQGAVIEVKGKAEIDELITDMPYNFYGKWDSYFNKRLREDIEQFHFQMFVKNQPYDRASVIAYLADAGAGYGVGRGRATLLWDKFGPDAVRVARENPEIIAAALAKFITPEQAESLSVNLRMDANIESSKLKLTSLFDGRGFRKTLIRELIRDKGNQAEQAVRRDPFCLLGYSYTGFPKVDQLYLDLGLNPAKMKRQVLAAEYCLRKPKGRNENNGDTWKPIEFAVAGIQDKVKSVSGTKIDPAKAFMVAKRAKRLAFLRTDSNGAKIVDKGGKLWVASYHKAANESYIANKFVQLMQADCQWPDVGKMPHGSDHQREQLAKATKYPVCSLMGGPGTGKTFTTASYISLLIEVFGSDNILIATPTNKAASRLNISLREYNIGMSATSTHRMLGVSASSGGVWQFEHNEANPLDCKVLILDEQSMVDTDLMAAVYRAIRPGTHVLFIGDLCQLSPVGHGRPFHDLIAGGLPYGELTEPRRNAGDVVLACEDIRLGRKFQQSPYIDWRAEEPKNFRFAEARTPEEQVEKLLKALDAAVREGFHPVWDVQVMVATNNSSKVSKTPLNHLLQTHLNSSGEGPKNAEFKAGDKIVCEVNGDFRKADESKSEVRISRGEFGVISAAHEKHVVARFDGYDFDVAMPVVNQRAKEREATSEDDPEPPPEEGEQETPTNCISLAYAATVHKMQGSECKVALPIVDASRGAMRLCTKEHFRTAISRGKLLTIPIGMIDVARQQCRKSSLNRRTFLAQKIEQAKAETKKQQGLVTQESISSI